MQRSRFLIQAALALVAVVAVLASCKSDVAVDPSAESISEVAGQARSEDAVLSRFEEYRQTLLDRDGSAAVQLVTSSTLEYYDRVLDEGVVADADDLLGSIPLSEALGVLAMRARLGSDLVEIEDGSALFQVGIDRGLVGDNVSTMRFDRIAVDGDEAFGLIQGQQVMRFVYVEGSWLVDLPFTTAFIDDNEETFISGMGGELSGRAELFEVVSLGYGMSWDELSAPVGS